MLPGRFVRTRPGPETNAALVSKVPSRITRARARNRRGPPRDADGAREGHEELGTPVVRGVRRERRLGLPLGLDLGLEGEEGVAPLRRLRPRRGGRRALGWRRRRFVSHGARRHAPTRRRIRTANDELLSSLLQAGERRAAAIGPTDPGSVPGEEGGGSSGLERQRLLETGRVPAPPLPPQALRAGVRPLRGLFNMPSESKYKKRGILATNAPTFPAPTRGSRCRDMNVLPEDLICACKGARRHPVELLGPDLEAAAVYPEGVAKQFALAMHQAEVLPIKNFNPRLFDPAVELRPALRVQVRLPRAQGDRGLRAAAAQTDGRVGSPSPPRRGRRRRHRPSGEE